jgi:PRC-barrel domain
MPTSRSFVIYCQIAFFAASPNVVLAQAGTGAPPAAAATETPAVVADGNAAETLLGKPVQSATGEDLGRIVDVIVDRSGMVQAVIIAFWASAPERSRLTGMCCTFRKQAVWKSSLPLCREINCERRQSSRRANQLSSWAGRRPRLLPPQARLVRLPRLRLRRRRRRTLRRPSPDGVGA